MADHDPMIVIRRVLERERFCKDVGDGALSEMILSVVEPIIRADERAKAYRKGYTDADNGRDEDEDYIARGDTPTRTP